MLYPDIDPVIFALGPLKVHWYGVTYLIGFAAFWWLGRLRARRPDAPLQPQQVDDLLFYGALGVVVGGRVGYMLFYNLDGLLAAPLSLFAVWDGGMSFHGGFLGVLVAMGLCARKLGAGFWRVTDFIAPLVPIGLGSVRIGNFINGELWGGPAGTAVPWAMQVKCDQFAATCFDKLGLPPGTALSPPLHPSQLYEAMLEGLVLFLMLWFYSAKPRPTMTVSALFLIGYGVFRFLVEFVRMPDVQLGYLAFGWVTMGQLLTLPMILVGVALFVYALNRKHT